MGGGGWEGGEGRVEVWRRFSARGEGVIEEGEGGEED